MFKRMDNMKIKGKLKYSFSLVIGLMIFICLLEVIGMFCVTRDLNQYLNHSQAADTAVKSCRIEVNIAARSIREMVLNDDVQSYDKYVSKIEENKTELIENLESLEKTNVLDEALYEEYKQAITDWIVIGDNIVEEIKNGNREHATKMILEQCEPALQRIVLSAKDIDTVTDGLKTKAIARNYYTVIFYVSLILITMVIAFFVANAVSKKIINGIVNPLNEIETAAVELSKGNLQINLTYDSDDEIGEVANSLRSSISTLDAYIKDIAQAMKEFSEGNFLVEPSVEWKGDFVNILESFKNFETRIAHTITDIRLVADKVTNSSEQVTANSVELANEVTEQVGVTEELTATIETVSERIRENADNANLISKEVKTVGVEIANSNGKMQEMAQSMDEIDKSSHEISNIIATINDIASQTNLLALNASIEAARAGEAGRGFAVVADQVSVLAAQSAEAAKNSATLIESSVLAVEKGMIIAEQTAKQLVRVVEGSQQITEKVDQIAEASEEQAESISQINQGVEHINEVVQESSRNLEESAASSQEMVTQAETLKELISEFNVKNY